MADIANQTQPPLGNAERAQLEAFKAKEAREKRIQEIMQERSAICRGAIPEGMLRDIAIAQIEHDEKNAAREAADKVAKEAAKK